MCVYQAGALSTRPGDSECFIHFVKPQKQTKPTWPISTNCYFGFENVIFLPQGLDPWVKAFKGWGSKTVLGTQKGGPTNIQGNGKR
jgi:hypothetical protein